MLPAEPECNCTGPWTQTIHASNPEGHAAGCPRWGAKPLPLPGTPGPTLLAVWEALTAEERLVLGAVLQGDAPAEWLAEVLRACGHQVSATTIRTYRRSLKEVL